MFSPRAATPTKTAASPTNTVPALPPTRSLTGTVSPSLSWDFSEIPMFAPAPLRGALQTKLVVGQSGDPLEHCHSVFMQGYYNGFTSDFS